MHRIDRLKELTRAIISPELHYGKVREACNELYDLFKKITGLDENDQEYNRDIHLDNGLAIGSSGAAFCLIDFWRTRNFLMGVHAAIVDRRKQYPDKPVTILYAGTGPFATLAVPFCSLYAPSELQLVLLEINPQSLSLLRSLIEGMELGAYIRYCGLADACNWSIPEELQPDILISETMKKGLEAEPQVAVFAGLVPQCTLDPILMPASIEVGLAIIGDMQKDPPEIKKLDRLLTLDRETAVQINAQPESIPVIKDGLVVSIPKIEPENDMLALYTEIIIYKEAKLNFRECSITLPHKIPIDISRTPCTMLFQYDKGPKPGFRFSYLP